MQKSKRLNRMCLKKNVEQQLASLQRAWKQLFNDMKKFQIEDRTFKICLPECKIEHPSLSTKIGNQIALKPEKTYRAPRMHENLLFFNKKI